VRVTSVFKRLLDLSGITVTDVQFCADAVVVGVRLRARLLRCPRCEFTTKARYDTRAEPSTWRHLDLAARRLRISADLRRLYCPVHGVITEGVPFARPGSRFTRDFEDLVGWLATTMDKTALARLVRVDWDTTGRIIERVVADRLDPDRLQHLFQVGVDEVSWRKGHSYLTLVSNHETGKFVWGREGKDAATLDHFFDDLGADRAQAIQAVSMDMSPAFRKSVSTHAGQAVICYDPFHVVALSTAALDKVRRQVWQELRKLPDQDIARRFRGARWALMKNPSDLTDDQAGTLRKIKRRGGDLWRAYTLKEALRAVFAGDLNRSRRRYPARSVLRQGIPQPPQALRHPGPHHPKATSGHPRRDTPGHHQRPTRRPQPPRPSHRQPRLRISLRQRSPRPDHAHPRTHQPRPTTRTHNTRGSLNRPTFMPGGPNFFNQE